MTPELRSLAILIVERVRALLSNLEFRDRHRRDEKAFTRDRKLPFACVMLLILQKTIKSLQLHLNEFFTELFGTFGLAATVSAWSQARAKLRHTAFIELNKGALLEAFYASKDAAKLWRGHRLLAIDSSTLRLPDCDALYDFFNGQMVSNQSGPGIRMPRARLSVLYDVLNHLGLDAQVGPYTRGEEDLSREHLSALQPGDVAVCDRLYASYLFLAEIVAKKSHFIVRCQKQSFAAAKALFALNEDGASRRIFLQAKTRRAEAKKANLPEQIEVRFLSVELPTGELEVLVTSLVDETLYPTNEFLEAYHQRWGVETYFFGLKSRLELENFSGLTVESTLQDIHAAVFLSNLESVLTREASERLPKAGDQARHSDQKRRYDAKPNRMVTFHSIKTRALDLLLGKEPAAKIVDELTELFRAKPVSVRPGRNPTRKKPSFARSLNFQKRIKKRVY
jgi:hypothetical protein